MSLWIDWFNALMPLRSACTRKSTFAKMVMVLAGFSIRTELAGVTSFIRCGFMDSRWYRPILNLFHTKALKLDVLTGG